MYTAFLSCNLEIVSMLLEVKLFQNYIFERVFIDEEVNFGILIRKQPRFDNS